METIKTLQFFDNEEPCYAIIKIFANKEIEVKEKLKDYQKEEDYNIDDFISILDDCGYLKEVIKIDEEVYF